MKKLIPMLLILSLLLTLCACGKKETPPAETPAPTEEPAPAEPTPDAEPAHAASGSDLTPASRPASGSDLRPEVIPSSASDLKPERDSLYPVIVPIGNSIMADLDQDGTAEEVLVDVVKNEDGTTGVVLTINGEDCSDGLRGDAYVQLDDPDPFFYAITDLYDGDPSLEIAIQDWGPSDDFFTNFYRYYDGSAYSIGGVPGMIRSTFGDGSITFDGNGNIFTDLRLNVLQTWYARVTYVLNNAEFLELEPAELYQAIHPTDVTLLTDLFACDGKGGDEFTVQAGVKMTVEATDNREWLYCSSRTEDWALWFHLNPANPFEIETPDGFVSVSDALDGLLFAD